MPVLEVVTFGAFAEVQRVDHGGDRRRRGRSGPATSRCSDVRSENERAASSELAQTCRCGCSRSARWRSRRATLQAAARAARARRRSTPPPPTVIAGGASPDFRTVTIDKGTRGRAAARHGGDLRRPASSAASSCRAPRAAKVQLLIDRNAAAGALIERTRAQGVVVGTGTATLRMEYVPGTADVKVGRPRRDLRHRRHLPEGLRDRSDRIGRARRRRRSAPSSVRPAVDFSSLEEVLVVLTPPRRTRGAEADAEPRRSRGARVRAVGVLIAIALALALQTTLARFRRRRHGGARSGAGRVVYVALTSGPVTGMLAGSVAGLIQDALSSGVIGIGGLAKTIVGFLVGRDRHSSSSSRRRCRGS